MAAVELFLRTLANDYQRALRDDCQAAAMLHRLRVEVHSAEDDSDAQLAQIEDAVRRHNPTSPILAILVSPVRENILQMSALDAVRVGIAYVLLNRSSRHLEELRVNFPAVPVFSVNADQVAVGRIQGRQIAKLLPGGGETVYMLGSRKTSSTVDRLAGAQEILQSESVKLTALRGDWSIEGGEKVMDRWLREQGDRELVNVVVAAQNDSMAEGARRAIDAFAAETGRADVRRIPVTGCDGLPDFGARLVDEGRLAHTVVIPSVSGRAIEAVMRWRQSGEMPPGEISLPVQSYPPLD